MQTSRNGITQPSCFLFPWRLLNLVDKINKSSLLSFLVDLTLYPTNYIHNEIPWVTLVESKYRNVDLFVKDIWQGRRYDGPHYILLQKGLYFYLTLLFIEWLNIFRSFTPSVLRLKWKGWRRLYVEEFFVREQIFMCKHTLIYTHTHTRVSSHG